ncbi:MAG: sigma-70 family RNA polymerase sigma factor [Candidatus Latescibacteria bacterium]|nr:sigma-70 family RNA polymerase sigma factor [Candidatus Latescibacterota bacterium]
MSRIGNDTSDESLLVAFREGREEAFTQLFRRYSKRIFGYVLGIVSDSDIADDVTQKVFVKLARRPEAYSPMASFSSWLHRVARNAALDALKSCSRQVALEELGHESGTSIPDPFNTIQPLLFTAIQKLEGAQREALVLREYSELSYREIAEITGRTLATVKQDIFQARQFLRKELAPYLERTEIG